MWPVLETTIPNNVGMGLSNILVLIVNTVGLLPYAKDFKIGVICSVLFNGLLFMGLQYAGMEYKKALAVFLTFLVIMCFSLYAVSKTTTSPRIV